MWDLPDGFTPGAGISGDFGRNFTRCKTCQTGLHQVEGFPEKNFFPRKVRAWKTILPLGKCRSKIEQTGFDRV